jgi:membrane protease YdiL (CAAX protease family)
VDRPDPSGDIAGLLAGSAVALAALLAVRGREVWRLRWQPDRHTLAAIATGLAAVAFSAAILGVPDRGTPRALLHFGGIYAVCGCLVPWLYVTRVERRGAEALGFRRDGWKVALAINVALGALLAGRLAAQADWTRMDAGSLAATSYQLLLGGLFELFLYYGFIHLRLRRAFGVVPAIVGSAAIYSLWHVGTELPMHADPWRGLLLLFSVGLLYHTVFAVTRNAFSIWPFFFWSGAITDFVLLLELPERMREGLGWATAVWVLMVAIPWIALRTAPRREDRPP